jgi:membrane protease YdiL (CAAX protease family)
LLLAYHLGVVFLPVRNAADIVTGALANLANRSLPAYAGLTTALSVVFVIVCVMGGRGQAFRASAFALVGVESALYAVLMRIAASYTIGRLGLLPGAPALGAFGGAVMSFGAGFYEEVAFRVVGFGFGLRVIRWLWPRSGAMSALAWAIVMALVFSAWHYLGPESFQARSFIFRGICGLAFTAIYVFRGFAPAVWTHALYDLWVLVL